MSHNSYTPRRLDYQTLESATQGNAEAIKMVLRVYSSYMNSLAMVRQTNQFGNISFIFDPIKLEDLKIQAISSILKFKIR